VRCFWIPRPRVATLAAAPARTVRRTIVATAAAAAPRAAPAVRRVAGLMLVCVAGAMPGMVLLRDDVDGAKAARAMPPAATAAAPNPATEAPERPPQGPWFAETGLFSVPPQPLPMPRRPVSLTPPSLPDLPMLGPPPPEPRGKPAGDPPGQRPPGPETPPGGDGFELTSVPPPVAVPLPTGAALLVGALGLLLLLAPRPRGQTRPSA
jgi:hypothetical protein